MENQTIITSTEATQLISTEVLKTLADSNFLGFKLSLDGKIVLPAILSLDPKDPKTKKEQPKEKEIKPGDEAARMWPSWGSGTQRDPSVGGSGGKVPKRKTDQ